MTIISPTQRELDRQHRERIAKFFPPRPVSPPARTRPSAPATIVSEQQLLLPMNLPLIMPAPPPPILTLQPGYQCLLTRPMIAATVRFVAVQTGISVREIMSHQRRQPIVYARQLVYHLSVRLGRSLPEIGHYLNRDHTSVLHGNRRITELRAKNPALDRKLADWQCYLTSDHE